MDTPDKIYIGLTNSEFGGVVYDTVSATFPNAKEYIRKDALLEWAKSRIEKYDRVLALGHDSMIVAQRVLLVQLIDKINSM